MGYSTDSNPSSADTLFETENKVIYLSPEDIASGALVRIFNEDSDYPSASTDNRKAQIRVRCKDNFEASANRKCPKTRTLAAQRMERRTGKPSIIGYASPNLKQKHATCRHSSPNSSLSRKGAFNTNNMSCLRKTKPTAPPTMIKASRLRGGTSPIPDLKVHNELIDPPEQDNVEPRNRRLCRQRIMSYYTFRLLGVILNCIILVAGFVHLGGAMALAVYRDIVLIIAKYEMCILVGASLTIVSVMLLILSVAGLCLFHDGTRGITAHAGCCLIMAAVIISLASLENSVEDAILSDAKKHMLSTIQPQKPHVAPSAWNKFHDTFKCCGVRGSWDWCYRKTDERETNESLEKNFLGVYVCMVPTSCCVDNVTENKEFSMPGRFLPTLPCVQPPTVSYTYRSGCLTPLKFEIRYLGKVYRIVSFCTVIALVLSAITHMVLCMFNETRSSCAMRCINCTRVYAQ